MNITATQAVWNERLEKLLTQLDPVIPVSKIKEHVLAGTVLAFEVVAEEISVGFFLVRIEKLYNDDLELVVLHAMSEVKGHTPLSHIVSVMLPDMAKNYGAKSIRIHSEMRKMDCLLEREGFKFQESIFSKKVANA